MDETTLSLAEGNSKVEKSILSMEQMNEQMSSIRERVDSIFDDIDNRLRLPVLFLNRLKIFPRVTTLYLTTVFRLDDVYSRLDVTLIKQEVTLYVAVHR